MPRYDGKGSASNVERVGRKLGLCEDSNLNEEQKEALKSDLETSANKPFGRGGRGFRRGYGPRGGYCSGRGRW
jgi:hypothetical protein